MSLIVILAFKMREKIMKSFIAGLLAIILTAGCATDTEKIEKRVEKLHKSMLTIDTHCDTPTETDAFRL